MSIQDPVAIALEMLGSLQSDANRPPAAVVMPPGQGDFIVGNSGGFVQLAIAALRAAGGEEQLFKKESWWIDYDLDWSIKGFKPDPDAHIYLPPTKTRFQNLWRNLLGLCVVAAILTSLLVGAVTIFTWLMHAI